MPTGYTTQFSCRSSAHQLHHNLASHPPILSCRQRIDSTIMAMQTPGRINGGINLGHNRWSHQQERRGDGATAHFLYLYSERAENVDYFMWLLLKIVLGQDITRHLLLGYIKLVINIFFATTNFFGRQQNLLTICLKNFKRFLYKSNSPIELP